jgi:membrane protein
MADAPVTTEPAAVHQRFRDRPLGWVKELFARLGSARTFGIAAEMAFWLFLSLLPLAAIAGLVVVRFAAGNWSTVAPLLDALPGATRELLAKEMGEVEAWNGGKVGVFAALTFAWLASSGIHAIFDALELQTEAAARPWWKKRLLSLGACVLLSIGVALLTLLGTGVGWAFRLTGEAVPAVTWLAETTAFGVALRGILGVAIATALIAGVYVIGLPHTARKRTPIVPGALFAALLQLLFGVLYSVYIRQAGTGGAYQAGLAVIGVTMTALYLFCIAVLAGAEVNQMVAERRSYDASRHGSSDDHPLDEQRARARLRTA